MNKIFNFAIDCGKSECKYLGKYDGSIQKGKFKNKILSTQDFGVEIAGNNYMVSYEDQSFLVGDAIGDEHINYDLSKQNYNHRLSIYLAITRLLELAERAKEPIALAQINLAINMPLSIYKSQKKKEEFEGYIKNNGELIALTVNNKPFSFRIRNVVLAPEGIGVAYHDMDKYREKNLLTIDIGSLNCSYLQFNQLVPQYDKMAVSTLGIHILRGKIAETLSSHYGTTIHDEVVEQIFKDKYLILDGIKQSESKEIIEKIIENHVEMIFNYAKSRKISFSNTTVVVVGGGSIVLKNYLLPYSFVEFTSDGEYANVQSFFNVLQAKTNGKA
jgi:plasmid segregation protein ParM